MDLKSEDWIHLSREFCGFSYNLGTCASLNRILTHIGQTD